MPVAAPAPSPEPAAAPAPVAVATAPAAAAPVTPAPAPLAVASLQPPALTVVLVPTAATPAPAPVVTLIPMQSLGASSTQPRFTLDTLRTRLGAQAMWVDLTGPAVTPAEVLDIDRSQDRFFTSNSVAAKVRKLAERGAAEPLQCTP